MTQEKNPCAELSILRLQPLSPLRGVLVGSWEEDVFNGKQIEAVKKLVAERKISLKEAYVIVMDKAKEMAGA